MDLITGLCASYLFISIVLYFIGLIKSGSARFNSKLTYTYSADDIYAQAKSAQFLLSHAFIWPLMIYKVTTGDRSWASDYIREYELENARQVIEDYERRKKIGGY